MEGLKRIIDILQEFNDYRRSQGKFADEKATIKDLQYSPKEIGDAIDEAIVALANYCCDTEIQQTKNPMFRKRVISVTPYFPMSRFDEISDILKQEDVKKAIRECIEHIII